MNQSNCCKPTLQTEALATPMPYKHIAAGVLIDSDNRLLISKRPTTKEMAGLWEFPGGKMNKDESPQMCLTRELKEELNIDVCIGCLVPLTFSSYRYDDFHLLMYLFPCRNWEKIPQGNEGQELKWVYKHQLHNFNMPPANEHIATVIRDVL